MRILLKAVSIHVCSTPLNQQKRVARDSDVDVLASSREDYIFLLAGEGRYYASFLLRVYQMANREFRCARSFPKLPYGLHMFFALSAAATAAQQEIT